MARSWEKEPCSSSKGDCGAKIQDDMRSLPSSGGATALPALPLQHASNARAARSSARLSTGGSAACSDGTICDVSLLGGSRASESFVAPSVGADVAACAADAAHRAVLDAFAELRPALLREIADSIAQLAGDAGLGRPQEGGARRELPRSGSRSCVASGLSSDRPRLSQDGHAGGGQRRLLRSKTTSSVASAASSFSQQSSSRGLRRAPTLPGLPPPRAAAGLAQQVQPSGPASVQSLEANLALALLEHSGFGLGAHGPRVPPSRSAEVPPQRRQVRVVPEPELHPALAEDHDGHVGNVTWGAIDAASTDSLGGQDKEGELPRQKTDGVSTCFTLEADGGTSEADMAADVAASVASTQRSRSKRRMTSDQVLQACIHELAQDAYQVSDAGSRTEGALAPRGSVQERLPAAPLVLFACGVLPVDREKRPWASAALQWAVRGLLALAVLAFTLPGLSVAVPAVHEGLRLGDWEREGSWSEVPLPLGAVLVLLPFTLRRQQKQLDETFALLRGVSLERGYEDWQARIIRRDRVVFLLIWLCIVAATAVWDGVEGELVAGRSRGGVMHIWLVAAFSAVILSVAYAMVYVCRSLSIMIDAFCCDVVDKLRLQDVAHLWNLTQAVLRQASNSVETCLLALCVVLVSSVPMLLVEVGLLRERGALLASLPGVALTCGVLYVLLLAATISEKCARVPGLINAVSFGVGTDRIRQHTVDYITSSAAGFYVFGMRLTTGMVLKFMYLWCIVAVGLLTELVSTDSGGRLTAF